MIKVQDVIRNYISGETVVKALRGVSLNIEKGDFLSIAGPSGSGKTTLLNLIGCIDKIDSGEIFINEKAVSKMGKKEKAYFRRENLGFVFQSFNLIPVLTAFENVALTLSLLNIDGKERHERTMQILKEVGLEGKEDSIPAKLSGGQQQRVAVARALIKNPEIVLADEPTANLDSVTGKNILDLMYKMNEKYKTTFIFSTHDPMVMDFAKRLVILHDGQITEDKRRS
jgi:putative ABC transport system ATP-binding protein